MVQITGKYYNERNENLEEYLRVVGFSEENIHKVAEVGGTFEAWEDGDKYTFKYSNGLENIIFLNQEYEPKLLKGVKCVAKREGDKFIVTSKFPNGDIGTGVCEFNENGASIVYTINNVIGKRFYKKI